MRQEFLETRKQATFSRALIDAVTGAPGKRRADHAAAQPARLLELRRLPRLRRARPVRQLLRHADLSSPRPAHAVPLLQLRGARSGPLPEVRQRTYSVSGRRQRSAWKQELHDAFPKARVARLDRDTVGGKRDYETILAGFRDHNYDILVGTQMIAKGHDIPNVTLVGIVNADIGLGLPDFRAAERTFQLLTQAAGRAGRGTTPGIVLMQTQFPDHYAIQCAAEQNYEKFYSKGNRVPAPDALSSVWRDGECYRTLKQGRGSPRPQRRARTTAEPRSEGVKVMGPAPAAVAARQDRVSFSDAAQDRPAAPDLNEVLGRDPQVRCWRRSGIPTMLAIDVDPMTLLIETP